MQWLSAALGGYVTGRLRTRWVGLHTHQAFFRDTAHGFITWSLATRAAALFFASAAGSSVRSNDESETLSLIPQRHSQAASERALLRQRNDVLKIVSDGADWTPTAPQRRMHTALQRPDPSVEGMP